jgi:hydrogenase maturation protease
MNAALVEQIVEAVLYEGYVLYPYRPSSKKNCRERFTFGRVYPEAYSVAQNGAEASVLEMQCLVKATAGAPKVQVNIRFLHPIAREIGVLQTRVSSFSDETKAEFERVPELRVGDRLFQTWNEAGERTVTGPVLSARGDLPVETTVPFRFSAWLEGEPIRDDQSLVVGIISRRSEMIQGAMKLKLEAVQAGVFKVSVCVSNNTPLVESDVDDRDAILLRTLASTHVILAVEDGEFVSLMDPSAEYQGAVASCRNIGVWPVLVGDEVKGERDMMLASPIILYDYPKIATESAGTLFDGTEIDEILTLRILTMSDDEKREMRHVDEQARRLLERTESLSEEQMLKMHGTMRRPVCAEPVEFDDFFGAHIPLKGVTVDGVFLAAGDRVRLRPKARADVIDVVLAGRVAVIESVEQDLEKRIHLAVVVETDPGKDLGFLRQPGHRFFYGVDEVEPLKETVP